MDKLIFRLFHKSLVHLSVDELEEEQEVVVRLDLQALATPEDALFLVPQLVPALCSLHHRLHVVAGQGEGRLTVYQTAP